MGGILLSNNLEYNTALTDQQVDVEKPLVVCIPSYNNALYYEECLKSVFLQKYSNYRVIYIDDASSDNTYKLVVKYVNDNNQEDRVIVLKNSHNMGMLYNHCCMAEFCEGHEIIVSLDGDDKFIDENVLSRINQAYADSDVWATYGQFIEIGEKYHQKPRAIPKDKLKSMSIRKMPFLFMQPRTYYAALFHKIPRKYFMFGGNFYKAAGDVAIMMFIMDLSGEHTYFIPEILYCYNNNNPINDHKVNRKNQLFCEKTIKLIPPLEPLKELLEVYR